MAARKFTREEILREILDEDQVESSEEEQEATLDSPKERLDSWINSFDGGDNFDSRFFRENARQVMQPIFHQSLMAYESGKNDGKLKGMSVYVFY